VSMRASFICWSRLLEETEGGVKEEKNYREWKKSHLCRDKTKQNALKNCWTTQGGGKV
jgi:hypothetical protein